MKNTQNKELGFETFRADVSGYDEIEETIDVVFATENPILLEGYKYSKNAEVFSEILLCNSDSIRTDGLNVGIPLFPSHWRRDSTDVIGKTISYSINDSERNCTAKIKVGARMDDMMKKDLASGVLNTVSVGVNIYKVMRSETDGKITYTALDWKPKHIALAPEPADYGAVTMRSDAKIEGETIKPIIENDLLKNLLTKK